MNLFFNNLDSKCKPDGKSNITINTSCYVRVGTNIKNSFINCIANVIGTDTKSLINLLLSNITFEIFNSLNEGAMNIIFDSKNTNKSSFQQFCEFIISNDHKPHELLIDILSKNEIIGKKINIFIIDCTDDSQPSLLCPSGYKIDEQNLNCILIKQNDKYDNVIHINGTQKKTYLFRSNNYIIDKLIKEFKKCSPSESEKNIDYFVKEYKILTILYLIITDILLV